MPLKKTLAPHVAVVLVLACPSILWFWFDQHVWEWDPSRYAHMSFDLWQYQFADTALWRWMHFHHFTAKAPGISWMGQFFLYLEPWVGSVNRALMFQMVGCTILGSLLLAKTIRRLYPQRACLSWIALVACFSSPLLLNLNQEYMTEPVQMLGICWVLWTAVSQSGKTPARTLADMLAAVAFLLISKGASALYVWGFGLWFLAGFLPRLIGRKREPFGASPGIIVALACATGFFLMVAAWYVLNFGSVFGYLVSASSGSVALAYGEERTWWEKNLRWLGFFRMAYASPALLLVLGLTLLAYVWVHVARRRNGGPAPGSDPIPSITWPALMQVLLIWALATRSPMEEWRILLGLLPSLVLLFAALLSRFRHPSLPAAMLAVLLGQWAAFHAMAFGWEGPLWLSSGQSIRVCDRSGEKKRELERIIRTTCDLCPTMDEPMMCAVSVPWLNSNTLRYHAATVVTDTPRYGYYGSTGFLTTRLDQLIENFQTQNPCVVITMDPGEQERYHTGSPATRPFSDYLDAHPFYVRVPFESGFGVRLYRKATPAEGGVPQNASP